MEARFIEETGEKLLELMFWFQNGVLCGKSGSKYHFVSKILGKFDANDEILKKGLYGFGIDDFGKDCECGVSWEEGQEFQTSLCRRPVFNTESGKPEPGDLFYVSYPGGCAWHANCSGKHLVAILPNGNSWDIDSRARNCTKPEDKHHRCWVRTGEPPNVTVGKGGDTCAAGAGSIACGDYHGFLRDGWFTEG